jgi:hypothetical protein
MYGTAQRASRRAGIMKMLAGLNPGLTIKQIKEIII